MPTYDYQCEKCNHQFEAFQSISDAPLTSCPKCSGKVNRLISGGAGILFKGSGFYVNDSKNSCEAKKGGGCLHGGSCGCGA